MAQNCSKKLLLALPSNNRKFKIHFKEIKIVLIVKQKQNLKEE